MRLRKDRKGSLTLETALVLPLFLFFCLNIASLVGYFQADSERMTKQTELAKNAAIFSYSLEGGRNPSVAARLGIEPQNEDVFVDENVDIYNLHEQKAWFVEMAYRPFYTINRATCRKWTGYDPTRNQMHAGEKNERIVYVVEQSEVFHCSKNCFHIDIRVHPVEKEEVERNRNKICSACKDRMGWGTYYKTDSSDIYHTSLNCEKIKRNITTLTETEAKERGLPPCKDCGR